MIQKIVRTHYSEFRICFEHGLARNARLGGRISVRFIIETDGSVKSASEDPGDDFPDPQVSACLLDRFRSFVFPQPERGIVTVVCPVILSPD